MDEKKHALLSSEYLHLQSTLEGFDGKALTIKTWSVTFSFTAFGIAFTNQVYSIFLIAAFASLIFWFLEASWKSFQSAYFDRIQEIEAYFRDQTLPISPLQITKSWYTSFRKNGQKNVLKTLFWYHIYLPHALIFITGIILFLFLSRESPKKTIQSNQTKIVIYSNLHDKNQELSK